MRPDASAATLGWAGLATGLIGLVVYIVVVLRQPQIVRVLNGSGLLLTSLAVAQAREMIQAAQGPSALAVQGSVGLLILAVIAQSAAGLRNRRAWDGTERRAGVGAWDGGDRRRTTGGEKSA